MESELFNQQIEKYVTKWKDQNGIDDLHAEIQKIDGTKIGKIDCEGLIHKRICLFDVDDSVVLAIYERSDGLLGQPYLVIKDSDEKTTGTTEDYVTFDSDMFLKNPAGEKILIAKGLLDPKTLYLNDIYEINAIDGKNIAKFEITHEKVKKSFWHTDHYHTCILQINDLDFDRKSLLGLFISILFTFFHVVRDYSGGGIG